MKKGTIVEINEKQADPDLLPEYDFSKGVRGKYVQRLDAGSNIVVLAPDVAEFFPDSESVNEALRTLVSIAQRQVKSPAKRNRTNAAKAVSVESQ